MDMVVSRVFPSCCIVVLHQELKQYGATKLRLIKPFSTLLHRPMKYTVVIAAIIQGFVQQLLFIAPGEEKSLETINGPGE